MQRGRATQEQLPSAANAVATSKATGIKDIEDEDMGRALLYFPLVGLVVGAITVLLGLSLGEFLEYWHGDVSVIQQYRAGLLSA